MGSDFSVLKRSIEGEFLESTFDLGRYATDASIYQLMPKAVVVPKTVNDAREVIYFAQKNGFSVLARGGGTSQNGQTVNKSIVIDNSKYLNKVLEFDPISRKCVVEPGIVLDELNRFLKPHGLFFPVDVSTSSRATIGGMAGNNSAGGRSIRYGIMRDNVNSIDVIMSNSELARFGMMPEQIFGLDEVLPELLSLGLNNRTEIERRFPKVLRRVGGYNLDALIEGTLSRRPGSNAATSDINLAHLIVGSEGTLNYSSAIELKLSPLPPAKIMALCHFSSFYSAMESAQHIVGLNPMTVELIDETMVSLARTIPLFKSTVEDYVKGNPAAILVVEFSEETWAGNLSKVDQLKEIMVSIFLGNKSKNPKKSGIDRGIVVIEPLEEQNRISEMRKSGLNIMMSMKSDAKPVSFVEDCAVPLPHLADYTQGLTDIFKKYGTHGTWYAHASVGCLHVRPVLNMKNGSDVTKMRAIALEAFELVKKFSGSHSGEHGDGISRSEFNPVMFGEKLNTAFIKLKKILDPSDLFNPGKIVNAPKMDARDLFRYAPGYKASDFLTTLDWKGWPGAAGGLQGAVEMCNNNGACRKLVGGVMCPSFRITRDEKDSTRGRANILRLAMSGQLGPDAMISDKMKESLKLCVSCKACKRECPTGVNVSSMKIEINALWAAKHSLSLHDRLIAYLTNYASVVAKVPWVMNLRDRIPGLPFISEKITGFSSRRRLPIWRSDYFKSSEINSEPKGKLPVILFGDTFNRYFEPENLRSAVNVLKAAGYTPFAPIPKSSKKSEICCGKTHLSVGNVGSAIVNAKQLVETYLPYASAGIPIVGLEPSCLFTIKDELPMLLKSEDADLVAKHVMTFEELLMANVNEIRFKPRKAKALLHGHCHQKAFDAMGPVEQILSYVDGLEVEPIVTSCCGMAGDFGYAADTFEYSVQMAELNLLPTVRKAERDTLIIADGTSCRSQIFDGSGRQAIHVARFLEQQLLKGKN
ncbi:MAG: FAD-binding and (Fe-S)-binding domain-containing protein [Paracoccaceae bacterium]